MEGVELSPTSFPTPPPRPDWKQKNDQISILFVCFRENVTVERALGKPALLVVAMSGLGGAGEMLGACPCLPGGFPSSLLPVHPSPGSAIGAPRLPRHLGAPGREKARCVPPWEPWSKPQGALSQLLAFHRLPNTMHLTLGVSVFYFFVTVICITLKTHDSSFELENKVTPSLRPVCVSRGGGTRQRSSWEGGSRRALV